MSPNRRRAPYLKCCSSVRPSADETGGSTPPIHAPERPSAVSVTLERDPVLKDIPVVVVTAFGELLEDMVVKSVIAKPVPLKLLYETVHEYCCNGASLA
jgi:hypothetical protein